MIQLILKFLLEHRYTESAHCLEAESRVRFDGNYFREIITREDLDSLLKAERYFSSYFDKIDNNEPAQNIIFEIRKHYFWELLNRDSKEALLYLYHELKEALDHETFNHWVNALSNPAQKSQLKTQKKTRNDLLQIIEKHLKEIEPPLPTEFTIDQKLQLQIGNQSLSKLEEPNNHGNGTKEEWQCKICTLRNPASYLVCDVCGADPTGAIPNRNEPAAASDAKLKIKKGKRKKLSSKNKVPKGSKQKRKTLENSTLLPSLDASSSSLPSDPSSSSTSTSSPDSPASPN